MEVSRIEAISPKQIDWRKLTSKEIIEYDKQGVEVPPQYLQWAQSFIADVNAADKDETTYEAANSYSINNVQNSQIVEEQKPEDMSAKQVHELLKQELDSNGNKKYDKYDIADMFVDFCKGFRKDCKNADNEMDSMKEQSKSEIEALSDYMSSIMENINELKMKLETEKSKKNKNMSVVNKLQAQIKGQGQDAQTEIGIVNFDIQSFLAEADEFGALASKTIDYGNETVDIGYSILKDGGFIGTMVFGLDVVSTGKKTKSTGSGTLNVKSDTEDQLDNDMSKVKEHSNEVLGATGVGAVDVAKEADKNSDNENKQGSENSNSAFSTASTAKSGVSKKNKDEDTNIDDSQDKTTDENIKAQVSIDEILKRKIRRGESVES